MFERYTEKARRIIFFGRYEASQFGGSHIETEHLLLGLLREDKALASRFRLSQTVIDSIRTKIERQTAVREKVSTSVDLPLSQASKRVLSYAAEEAERLSHQHIGAEHMLLGLLREEKCFAAQLLGERGVTLDSVRKHFQQSQQQAAAQDESASFAGLDRWLADCETRGFRVAANRRGANSTARFAIYRADQAAENEKDSAAAEAAQIRQRIHSISEKMENAIVNHEFEKARFYSAEEQKERENLRLLHERFNQEVPPQIPILCIETIGDQRFAELQQRCEDSIADGVAQIWLLNPELGRAYTFSQADGLRECRGGVLRIVDPPLEMDLGTLFA